MFIRKRIELARAATYVRSVLFALLLAAMALVARAQVSTGTIDGTVGDPTHAAIAGAQVIVTNVGTSISQLVQTDDRGRFLVQQLTVGVYKVDVRKEGFASEIENGVNVIVGTTSTVNLTLQVGQANQTVNVEADQVQMDTSSGEVSSLVDQEQVSSLPLNGRDYQQLILLAPGVQLNTSQPTDATHGRDQGYSVNGQRAEGQYFLLDGTLIQNYWNNGGGNALVGTSLGVEAIAEFTILTNAYGAQYGGSGAVINQVTRSGTNHFHGTAYDYLRNSAFDARNYFDPLNGPPAFRRNQFGGSVGGPIVSNKAFFFVNYEGLRQMLELSPIYTVPTPLARGTDPADPPGEACIPGADGNTCYPINAIQAATLAQYPLPSANLTNYGNGTAESQVLGGETVHENYVNARVDYTRSSKDTFFARVVNDPAVQYDPEPQSPGYPETGDGHDVYVTGQYKRTVSSSLINLAQFGFTRTLMVTVPEYIADSPIQYYPGLKYDGDLGIAGLSIEGIDANTPISWIQNRFTYSDHVIWSKGAHNISAGVDVIRMQTNNTTQLSRGGQYTFLSLQAFYLNQQCPANQATNCTVGPYNFSGAVPGGFNSERGYREVDIWPYIQDDWRITSKLTLNFGVRYDYTTNPVEVKDKMHEITDPATSTGYSPVPNAYSSNPSVTNIEPRFGFAYAPFANDKTTIRGGVGLYDNVITPTQYSLGYDANPPYFYGSQSNPAPYPIAFSQISGSVNTPFSATQPLALEYKGIKTPYIMAYNLNIERQLSRGSMLTVAYIGSKGTHNFMLVDKNPAVATTLPNGQIYFPNASVRLNPNLGALNFEVPTGISHYDSGQVTYNETYRSLRAQLAYTFSHCLDTGSQVNESEDYSGSMAQVNPYSIKNEYSRCNYDVRQNITANAVAGLPMRGNNVFLKGWELNGIFQVRTGSAFTANDGFNQSDDGDLFFEYDRPNLVPGRSNNPKLGQVNHWFDSTAFVLQPLGTMGDVRRDTLTGPGIVELDMGLDKKTLVPKISETFAVEVRADFFNLLNNANFQEPNTNLYTAFTPVAGQPLPTGYINGGVPNPSAGVITSTTTTARQIQLAVKFIF
jgi:hypothetical protein